MVQNNGFATDPVMPKSLEGHQNDYGDGRWKDYTLQELGCGYTYS